MKEKVVELTYPSKLESIDLVLEDVSGLLRSSELKEGVLHSFLVSLSEAFTNAVVHGNGLVPEKVVTVHLRINRFEISADIIDQGMRGMEKIGKRIPAKATDEGGRGIDIIRHYMKSVDFSEDTGGGLRVSMTFALETREDKEPEKLSH